MSWFVLINNLNIFSGWSVVSLSWLKVSLNCNMTVTWWPNLWLPVTSVSLLSELYHRGWAWLHSTVRCWKMSPVMLTCDSDISVWCDGVFEALRLHHRGHSWVGGRVSFNHTETHRDVWNCESLGFALFCCYISAYVATLTHVPSGSLMGLSSISFVNLTLTS